LEGVSKKVELKYNLLQQSVRVSNDDTQRVFFLERSGFWNNKTIFKNEYGLEIGKMSFEKGFHAGNIEVDGNKFPYIIEAYPTQQLLVFDEHSPNPILTCDLSASGYKADQDLSSLLLGLCWSVYPSSENQNPPAYSTVLKTA
jgi:hypothetical protein